MKNRFFFVLFPALFICSSLQKNKSTSQNDIIFKNVSADSHLKWKASHIGGVAPRFGKVFIQEINAVVSNNQLKSLVVNIDMNSILVDNFKNKNTATSLESHLKSIDFFNTTLFPTSTFKLTEIINGNEEFNSLIRGNLTILNQTNPISFLCDIKYEENKVTLHSKPFKIDRTKWGIEYNKEGSKGISKEAIISNYIIFEIEMQMNR